MRRLVLPPAARRDLNAILIYIARQSGSLRTAQQFVQELRDQCRRLAALPGTLGRARPEFGPDLRSFAYGNYVIFFIYERNAVRVVNVLEGHRDQDAFFRSDNLE